MTPMKKKRNMKTKNNKGDNRLIALLEKENDVSEKGLKRLFRRLCKSAHPDATGGKGERFIGLRRDYEEALALIRTGRPAEPALPRPVLRERILDSLRRYAMREMTREAEKDLLALIDLSKHYDPPLAALWRDYRGQFYQTYSSWVSEGDVYYAHGHFIAIVKQFFYYREAYTARHRTLFLNYLKDLDGRLKKLDPERAATLLGIARWLERELDAPRV